MQIILITLSLVYKKLEILVQILVDTLYLSIWLELLSYGRNNFDL